MRLDLFLTKKTGLPRHQVQKMIQAGGVRIAGQVVLKPAYLVNGSEEMQYQLPQPQKGSELVPEKMALGFLYEDDEIAVVNKPADLVIHPAAGHSSGTLVNGLLYRYGTLPPGSDESKPGIVHRLDKGTSGCLVVARTKLSMEHLQRQFKQRQVKKIYLALVCGQPAAQGIIHKPIGRHPKKRQKISSHTRKGRPATTEWKVLETFGKEYCWVEVHLHTGRTHQIRVHFAEAGFPLLGDPTYGRRKKVKNRWIHRPALHAWRLGLEHPTSHRWMEWEAPIPEDLNQLLKNLRTLPIGISDADSNPK